MNWHCWISLERMVAAAICACLLLPAARAAQPATPLVYPRYFATADTQREFDWIVLRTALEKTVATHGHYEVTPWHEPMSVPRMLQELALPDGRINVIARASEGRLRLNSSATPGSFSRDTTNVSNRSGRAPPAAR